MFLQLFQVIIILSLTGTIVSVPLILFKNILLKRYGGKWYYYIWLFALLMFIIPIGYAIPTWVEETSIMVYGTTQTISNMSSNEMIISSLVQTVLKFGNYVIHSKIFLTIWLLGMIISAAYYVFISLWFLRKIIRKSSCVTNIKVIKTLQDGCYKMNIKSDLKLRSCSEINSPILVGLLNPIIILPTVVLQSTSTNLELIIAHELMHYKNKDILYKHFILFVKVIHWFNPFIYAIAKTINESCDYACDYNVTKQMDNQFSLRYANMILNTIKTSVSSSQSASYLTVNLFRNKKNIKRRFELIMMKNNKKKVGITVFTLVAILGVSAFTMVMAARVFNESPIINSRTEADTPFSTSEIVEDTIEPEPYMTITREMIKTEMIKCESLIDNGDGSFRFKSEDGQEWFLAVPGDVTSKIKNGELEYIYYARVEYEE